MQTNKGKMKGCVCDGEVDTREGMEKISKRENEKYCYFTILKCHVKILI